MIGKVRQRVITLVYEVIDADFSKVMDELRAEEVGKLRDRRQRASIEGFPMVQAQTTKEPDKASRSYTPRPGPDESKDGKELLSERGLPELVDVPVSEFCVEISRSTFRRTPTIARPEPVRNRAGLVLRRLNQMWDSKAYKAALGLPKTLSGKANEQRREAFANLRVEFSLNEYAANSLASEIRQSSMDFQLFVPSKVAQDAGKRAWVAVEKKMFGKSKRCRFKSKNAAISMHGNSNAEAPQIKFEENGGLMIFKKRLYSLKADKSPEYFKHGASCRVKNPVILKRKIRGEVRWFVQIALEGQPYRDFAKERKHKARLELRLGDDFKTQSVSVDFGPSRVAISNEKHSYERKIVGQSLDAMLLCSKRLQRAMSRSIKLGNKEAFKTGKLKKGAKLKRSKKYMKLKDQK